jgi:hypothetical protein
VSAPDFSFTLELSDEEHFEPMLAELTAAVGTHAGLPADATKELTAAVGAALSDGAAKGQSRCDVGFSATAGTLQIVVRFAGGGEWRASRTLPAGQA